ncbi:hypothetical protein [Fodinicola feengrottensis]|uniref:hypothetical protein n=1 Tax=Fodinicola feengrottensis TaxID=435914 RepID=UPI0024412D90
MAYERVLVERDGPVATITMNRPERRNALSLGPPARAAGGVRRGRPLGGDRDRAGRRRQGLLRRP